MKCRETPKCFCHTYPSGVVSSSKNCCKSGCKRKFRFFNVNYKCLDACTWFLVVLFVIVQLHFWFLFLFLIKVVSDVGFFVCNRFATSWDNSSSTNAFWGAPQNASQNRSIYKRVFSYLVLACTFHRQLHNKCFQVLLRRETFFGWLSYI